MPAALLAPLIEAAWDALLDEPDPKDGVAAVECPARLRRFQGWSYRQRLPAAEMITVLDSDAEFRAAIAKRCSEDDCGEVGWLWLTRPDGWRQDLITAANGSLNGSAAVSEADREQAAAEREVETLRRRSDAAAKRHRNRQAGARRAERRAGDARQRLEDALKARGDAEAALAAAIEAEQVAATRHQRCVEQAEQAGEVAQAARCDRDRAAEALRRARARLPQPTVPQPKRSQRRSPPSRRKTPLRDLLVVDGYNLAFRLWQAPQNDPARVASIRACTERHLAEYAAARHVGVKLVWDGTREQQTAVGARRSTGGAGGLEVRFSQSGRAADDVIARICAAKPAARKVIVATDDTALAARVRRHGAVVWGQRRMKTALRAAGVLRNGGVAALH